MRKHLLFLSMSKKKKSKIQKLSSIDENYEYIINKMLL